MQMILAQANRDEAVLSLLKKLSQVYDFMTQDDTLDQISSVGTTLEQISQQTLERAHFIRHFSAKNNFCDSPTSHYILRIFNLIMGKLVRR